MTQAFAVAGDLGVQIGSEGLQAGERGRHLDLRVLNDSQPLSEQETAVG